MPIRPGPARIEIRGACNGRGHVQAARRLKVTGDKMSSVATVCPVTELVCGTRIVCQCGGGRLPEDEGRAEYYVGLLASCEHNL